MYMNKIFKGSWAVACACVALSVQAQSLQQVAPLSTRMQAESEISPLQVASRNLPTFKAKAGKVVNVNHMNATSSQRFQKNARISGTNNQKPGTSYAVNKGVYNLVSGIALGQRRQRTGSLCRRRCVGLHRPSTDVPQYDAFVRRILMGFRRLYLYGGFFKHASLLPEQRFLFRYAGADCHTWFCGFNLSVGSSYRRHDP